MKAILIYAIIMLKRFLRDPVYLFFMFAFPLIFLFIFGTIFGNGSNVSFNVAIINHADNDFTKTFVEELSKNEALDLKQNITNLEDAKGQMSRGELDSIIEIPENFGEPNAQHLPTGNLNVYYDEGAPQAGQTIASIMSVALDNINVGMTGQQPLFSVEQKSIGATGLSQFDYTFAGLLSYVLMTMGIYMLSQQLPSEKKAGSLRRIKATPFKPWQLMTSLTLVYLILTLLSAALMVVVGIVMFDFQMHGSWLALAVFSIISTLTMIGFGAVVAGAARNSNQATMASQLIAFPMMFLSGVFFPRFLMPDWLQGITNWIPLTPVGDGIRYITTESATLVTVWPQFLMIAGWGIVAYIVAFRVFKWE